jgi:hypothetical protein
MPVRILRARTILVITAALVAGCGPAATSGPVGTSGAVGSPAPVTQPPATQPAAPTGGPLDSFALPSLPSEDADLEALLPDELGGEDVLKSSMTGDSFLGTPGAGGEEIAMMLQALGKQPADLSVAFGGTSEISVIAYQVKGIPATQVYASYLQLAQQSGATTSTDTSLGGKSVKKVVSEDGTVYIYTAGDVVFSVSGDDISPALLDETFSKLP